ncbi:MAG TPA: sensor histidine kinase, partial [Burkholderiales bacterium]|nr:sensor histidine kinase [Burkholderiales bacterium]
LEGSAGRGVVIFSEYLNYPVFSGPAFADATAAYLAAKYRARPPAVIVVAAEFALELVLRHRRTLFPRAPVLYFGAARHFVDSQRPLPPDVVGTPVDFDVPGSIALALQLHPKARRLVVVTGTSDWDHARERDLRALAASGSLRVPMQHLAGLPLEAVTKALAALGDGDVVYSPGFFADGSGRKFVPREAAALMAAASAAPVYGPYETFIGTGVVGGRMPDFTEMGREAGREVLALLDGKSPAQLAVPAGIPARAQVDGRQMRRWGIDERLLPADCEVRFREITPWDRYRGQILAGLAVILAQGALIIALVLNRRRLRRARNEAREELGRRTEAEGLAARLRNRLGRYARERSLGAMASAISHEINQPLIAIQNYAQAAKRRLASNDDDRAKLIELYGKIESQAERAGAITQRVRSLVSASEPLLLSTPPRALLDEIIRIMEPETGMRGCQVTAEAASGLPRVLADALQVELVLVNLVRNAMHSVCTGDRYEKRIRIEARPADDREVQFSVADRGPGVPPGRAEDIFEPLASATSGGMGMGLAISREIVQAHGGRLWYEPDPSGGAIFRFTLRAVPS